MRISASASMLALGLICACGDSPKAEQARQEATEAWAAARDFTVEKKDDFVRASESMLADLDHQLDQMKASASDASSEAMQSLERQREALSQKIHEAGQATAETWDQARDSVVKAYDDLKRSIQEAIGT